jgi:hypothetical protein
MPNRVDSTGERPSWNRFWFAPTSEVPLERMRVAVGVLVVLWLLSFFGRQAEFFGFSSWLSQDVYAAVKRLPGGMAVPDSPETRLPTPPWSPMYFAATPAAVHAIYAIALGSAAAFAWGIVPAVTAPLTWLGVCAFTSNPIFNGAGGESMLLVLTFYLMVGFLLRRGLPVGVPDRFALRLMQVHVAILVFSSALGKLQQSIWWEGIALWFPRHPAYELTAERINELKAAGGIATELLFMSIAAYLVLAWQLTFPFLAFQKRARRWIVGGAFLGMLGAWYFYRLPMFGPTWFVASLAFLDHDDWQALAARFGRASPVSERESVHD